MPSLKFMPCPFQSAGPIPERRAMWQTLQLIPIWVIMLSPVMDVEALRNHPGDLPDRDPLDHDMYLPGQRNPKHRLDQLLEISRMFETSKASKFDEQRIYHAKKSYKCCVYPQGDNDTELQDVTDFSAFSTDQRLPQSKDCSIFSIDHTECECMFGNGWISFEDANDNKGCLVKRGRLMDVMGLTDHEVDVLKSASGNPELPFHRSKKGEENRVIIEFRIENLANSRTGFSYGATESKCWRALDEQSLVHRLNGDVFIFPDEGNLHCKSGSEDYDYHSMLAVSITYGQRLAGVVRFEGFGRDVSGTVYWSYFCTTQSKNGYSLTCNSRSPKHEEAKQAYTVYIRGGPTSNEPGGLPYDLPNGNPLAGK
mmetsp:Transcript_128427/g.256522  ORF Transcript_128427/g.256522 Transcript_128427/m.256522 type:complete len:368 (+) Transcript_128427:55-1158(+)|eukprot:CAMPEP_0172672348 /NCGR_PEP_ID=MMETSP1074-20121228/11487_1 /TAXON_ID=2916 /ORGANISM="Ceratium fusus, Strain PA161109" /LENGTH=367 /DNA_ID=CAMNT_0013489519 /DNA_START=53 /DNA_END=1156 /DNA_ORIENTATION=-